MAGSYHAGTALVDVLPSLKGFQRTVRSELRSINPDVTVPVKPNMAAFDRQMRSIKAPTVQLKVEANTAALKKAEAEVTAAEKRMANARDNTSDASARLDIAEKQLAETRAKSSSKASQIATAELRVAQAKRAAAAASNDASNAEAALTAARKNVKDVKLKIDADSTPAANTLRAFAARVGRQYAVKIGVDADTTAARMTLQAFAITAKRTASVTGNVSLDTGAALTKLTLLGARGAAMGAMIAGGAALAGGAIAALPAIAAAVVGPISAIAVGINGVGDALSAFSDADNQAAANATANAKEQVSAARQIASAQQQLTQAQTGLDRARQDADWAAAASARQVQDAQRSLVQAEKNALKAEQELTQAREDARRAMQDLAFQVRGGVIAEKEAVLDLADAQQALVQAQKQGVTGSALQRLQDAYDQQQLSLEQIRADNQNLQSDQTAAAKAGIEGSKQVVAAQDQVAQATDAIAQAQQGVADARQAAAQQEIQSQRSIADAQTAVAQAQTQLTQAIQDSATVGAGAVDKINAAMANLSPNAQAFVRTIQALKPEFAALKNEVQDALFANLGPEFSTFAKATLPQMATNLAVVAGALGGVTIQMLRFLATQPVMALFQQLFTGLGPVIAATAPVLQTLITLFLQLAAAAMPGILALVQAIGQIATALLSALQPLINSGAIVQAVTLIAQVIGGLAPILGIVVSTAVQLLNALGPSLLAIIGSLQGPFQILANVLLQIAPIIGQIAQMVAAALLPVFAALAPVIAGLMPVIQQLIGAALQILVPLISAAAQVMLALMPAVQAVIGALMPLVPVIISVIQAITPMITMLISQLAPILGQVAQMIVSVLVTALQTLLPVLPPLFSALMSIVAAVMPLVQLITQLAPQLAAALLPALVALIPIFVMLLNALLPILPPLVNLVMTLLPILVSIIQTAMPLITFLANLFSGLLAVVLETIVVPIIDLLINAIKILVDIFGFMWSVVQPIWQAFGAAAQWAWNNMLKPAFDAIKSGVDAVGDWFKKMGDTVGGIWDGLKKLVHGGIQGIVDIVYNNGIRALANAVIKYIPGVDYLPELKVPDFAGGGVLPGYGPGRDTVPAMLSPGEAILVPELVRALGPQVILAANARAMRGRGYARGGIVGRFADGGVVTAGTGSTGTGSNASPVTVDPSALTGLADTADATTQSVTDLASAITSVLIPALAELVDQNTALIVSEQDVTTTILASSDTIAARQILLQQQMTTSWVAIQNATWASVNGQNQALAALQNGMAAARSAMQATADWAVSQWGRMTEAAAGPVRWVLANPFNAGIIAAWNALNADFALGKPVAPVPIPFATGGAVSGPGTATSDSIPALLSDGEFVVRAGITRRILPFLEALNGGQAEALRAAGYATGGLVADTGSALGATVARGQQWLAAQAGKPYIWGGVGPVGFDCSGLMSALTNVLRGDPNPYHRLGTTDTEPWPGFVPGLSSAFAVGWNSHHTAGTLGGLNGEARDFNIPVLVGPRAAGADSAQFTHTASLPFVGGKFIPGGGSFDPSALVGPYFADTYRMIGQVATLFAANVMAAQAAGIATQAADRAQGAGVGALNAMLATTAAAGSPEVMGAVRAVANRYGWGAGPEWNALWNLIMGESSGNPNATNGNAKGLFQKMTSVHGPVEPTVAGQTEWGLSYIRGTYGDPINAWRLWQSRSPHWYHAGGKVLGRPGTDVPIVATPGERVLSVAQTRAFDTLVSAIAGRDYSTQQPGSPVAGGVTINNHVYPREGQDESAVAADTSRRMSFALRTL